MPKMVKPLNPTQVQKAKAKDKEYSLSDGDGLMLSVRPTGSKVWIFKYQKPYSKKRTNLTFGKFPAVSLADARKKRDEAKELLAKDIDPKEHRDESIRQKEEAGNNTLEAVAAKWFKVKKSKISEDHAHDIWRSLELHIFPSLGKYPISVIKANQAIDKLNPIAAKGNLETVKRLCQRINEVMTFAVNTGLIEHNPLAKIHAAFEAPKKKNMPTLEPEELPRLMQALATANIKLTTRCLIEFQLHTMTRPSEAAGTPWSEFDLENKIWIIPPERMKAKKEHRIPLTEQVLALLEVMKPISGHLEFVFPGDRNPKKPTNSQTANAALKRMGFKGELVSHGMRSIASTTLNEQGYDYDVIEKSLSHIEKNEVRRAYNRADYMERRRILLSCWSEHIENAAKGNLSLSSHTNVTHLERKNG